MLFCYGSLRQTKTIRNKRQVLPRTGGKIMLVIAYGLHGIVSSQLYFANIPDTFSNFLFQDESVVCMTASLRDRGSFVSWIINFSPKAELTYIPVFSRTLSCAPPRPTTSHCQNEYLYQAAMGTLKTVRIHRINMLSVKCAHKTVQWNI